MAVKVQFSDVGDFTVNYIIMDLEWNNTYCKKKKGFMNEIIEIGAVKLNSNLDIVDTFSVFIKAQLGKKLHARVKELTNITNDDISSGTPFSQAMSQFRKWVSHEDNVILTWGDTDIRVLIENFKYFNGISFIPFLSNYVNLQKYAQAFMNISKADQIGLSAAAEKLGSILMIILFTEHWMTVSLLRIYSKRFLTRIC